MSAPALVAVAVVVLPIVLLLAFSGCGLDTVGTKLPDEPLPERQPDPPPPPVVTEPPPGGTEVPVVQPDPNRYHKLVTEGPAELIAYWKLEDTAVNAKCADSGPAPVNDGIYRGGVVIADGVLRNGPGPLDNATAFNGSTGFVNVAHDVLMNPVSNTNFSLEAWILPTATATATGRRAIAGSYRVDAAGAIDRGFVLELIGGATPRVRARTAPSGVAEAPLAGGVGGWHHVVMTYEGSATRLRLYVNGTLRATDASAGYVANRQSSPTDVVTPLRIAAGQREPFDPASPAALFFAGRIDQVALYRAALTATAVADHFAAATSP
jgi:hypothetical protein